MTYSLTMYRIGKPGITYDTLQDVALRINNLLGPAVPEEMAWGLQRPGLLSNHIIIGIRESWKARIITKTIPNTPQIMGSWIVFDYLFSKGVRVAPLVARLRLLGIIEIQKAEFLVNNTYLVTIGLNVDEGLMFFLTPSIYSRSIKSDLDDLAYVVSHALECMDVKRVNIDSQVLSEAAYLLLKSPTWKFSGLITSDGKDLRRERLEIIEEKIRQHNTWEYVEFRSKKYGKIKLSTIDPRPIRVSLRKRIYELGPQRDLGSILNELSRVIKPRLNNLENVKYNNSSEILKAYTERRGVIASKHVAEHKYMVIPRDVSYEFVGYDVEAGENKIEVKAFRGEGGCIELTEHEHDVMQKQEHYRIFIVENAWERKPIVNIIENPKGLDLGKHEKPKTRIETQFKLHYTCNKEEWEKRVNQKEYGQV